MSKTKEELLDDIERANAKHARASAMASAVLDLDVFMMSHDPELNLKAIWTVVRQVEIASIIANVAVLEAERAMEDRLVAESYQHDAQVDHPGREG